MSEQNTPQHTIQTGPRPGGGLINNKTRLVLILAVLALSLGYLLYSALGVNARYYLTVSEFLEDDSNMAGRPVRVVGTLAPGSHVVPQGTLDHSFTLIEEESRLGAFYSGVLPDLFDNEHSEIVLEGKFQGGSFHAESVIVKCPSKYEAENRGEAL